MCWAASVWATVFAVSTTQRYSTICVRATFLPEDEKQTLLREIKQEIELLRASLAGAA
jgi:hypothetical protein